MKWEIVCSLCRVYNGIGIMNFIGCSVVDIIRLW